MPINLPIEKWQYMVNVGLWPKRGQFDPIGWMDNFHTDDDKRHALRLLEAFTYFSTDLVQSMLRSSFLSLSKDIVRSKDSYVAAKLEWNRFISSVLVVQVTGEDPSPADSGNLFARWARDYLAIPESRIVNPETALSRLSRNQGGSILFVDDFVGSGNQFIATWERTYQVDGLTLSFKRVASFLGAAANYFYIPIITTALGKSRIESACPEVQIRASHVFGSEYSALHNPSIIWKQDLAQTGPEFVRRASARANIPFLNGQVGCFSGFGQLGLSLAFGHSQPDATLPLYTWSTGGWKPLLKLATL